MTNFKFCGTITQALTLLACYHDLRLQVKDHLLNLLYSASDLTPSEGSQVVERFPRMAALLPSLQDSLGGAFQTLNEEPLFQSLRNFSSVGSLVSCESKYSYKSLYIYLQGYKGLLSRKGIIVIIIMNNFCSGTNPKIAKK